MIKKWIFSFIIIVSLCMTGCVGYEYLNYPTLEYNTGDAIYNGKKYEYIVTFRIQELNLIPVYDEQIIVARTSHLLEYFPIYFSNRDVEKEWMISNVAAGGTHYIKEGFSLPNGNTLTYSEVYFTLQDEQAAVQINSKNPQVDLFGVKLADVIDMNNVYWSLDAEEVGCSLFISQEYPYIAWGNATSLMLYNNEVYIYNWGIQNSRYYRIRDEYQATFKTAIEELNEMQS